MADDVAHLIERMEAHENEGVKIQAEQDRIGLDDKKLKAIRKAKAAADAAQKTLDALMGSGLLPDGATLADDQS
jgi:N12 class adenine-specific DNA methylase